MSALRRREWVALALFAFAVMIAATFIDATAGPDIAPRTPVLGEPAPTVDAGAAPFALASPTAATGAFAETDRSWAVEFSNDGDDSPVRVAIQDTLDVRFDTTPFDLVRGRWRLEAVTTPTLDPGEHILTIEYTGAVSITVDGNEVAAGPGTTEARRLSAAFDHAGGRVTIAIHARPTGDAFQLQVK